MNNTNALKNTDKGPWYRQRWPWLLMLPPLTAVIAGGLTMWIAVVSFDGLVEDDYYKQGLGVNQRLARDEAALALGLSAEIMLAEDGQRVRLLLRGGAATPDQLGLKLTHPTLKGHDQTAVLQRGEDGLFSATLSAPINGRRVVILESPAGDWRLVGEWLADRDSSLSLSAVRP